MRLPAHSAGISRTIPYYTSEERSCPARPEADADRQHVATLYTHRTSILIRRRFSTRIRAFRVHGRWDRDRENAVGGKACASRL